MNQMPRPFVLYRRVDSSGVSGTGVVAAGAQFADGRVALRWIGAYASTASWDSLADAMEIHGHDGDTTVLWADEVVGPNLPREQG